MVILFSLPVALSFADTCRMPLASMSNCDLDLRHAARRRRECPSRLNWPRLLLPEAMSRSPCSTWIVTADWLSSAVENTCCALVGMVVFFWISLVITPPSVSMPSDSGVTSSSSTSLTSPLQHAALDRRADGDRLVRVHVLARLLAEELLDLVLHLRHARHGRRPG